VTTAGLPALIRALLSQRAYPHPAGRIELVQTHVSYVLLAGDYVYKIKKPVNFGFLDYSTLGKRRYYCGREVALNSRLCSDTYLGVVPVRESGGRYAIGGEGKTVEYAVHMRRLPEDRMMHRLLERGQVTPPMVEAVADKLAAFHGRAETSPRIARFGDWAIRYNWRENLKQWQPFIGRTISAEQDRILLAYGETFMARRAEALERRAKELRIKRVHADLRSDAVCFRGPLKEPAPDGICIFDCVEFSRRLSLLDVARDVGFLAMDLEYRGRAGLARAFVDRYVDASGDGGLRGVLDFYAAYSACVRGKVESFLLDLPEIPPGEKRRARGASRRYFELACRYAESLPPAMLVIMCGLQATGKSSLAALLAEIGPFEVLSSDVVRKRLAGLPVTEHQYGALDRGIYSPEFTRRTYEAMLEEARARLLEGRSVILDATFARREHRRAARRLARETGAQFACVYLTADDEAVQRRLARRIREGSDPSDADWGVYRAQKRRFQRPLEVEAERLITVTLRRTAIGPAREVLRRLRRVSPLTFR
jgi:aminoglycoside phosphotransferase family enzyme/predicted kinase